MLGINGGDRAVTLAPLDEDVAYVDDMFFAKLPRPAVGLFPGAGHPNSTTN